MKPRPATRQPGKINHNTRTAVTPSTENQGPQQDTTENAHKNNATTKKEEGSTCIAAIHTTSRQYGCLHRGQQTQGERKGAAKKPAGQREKVRCLFLMPCIAIMALLLLLAPMHTEGPVYLLPVNRRVRKRYTPPLRHRHGYARGPNPHSCRIWQPGLLLLYVVCFFHTPTAPITAAPCRYHAPVTITTVTSPYNTRYNTN